VVRYPDGVELADDVDEGVVAGARTPYLKLAVATQRLLFIPFDTTAKLSVEATGGDCVVRTAALWLTAR
jgi:hypothetical protein